MLGEKATATASDSLIGRATRYTARVSGELYIERLREPEPERDCYLPFVHLLFILLSVSLSCFLLDYALEYSYQTNRL